MTKPVQAMTVTVGANGRSPEDDPLLRRAGELLKGAGFELVHTRTIGSDPKMIQELVRRFMGDLDAIIVLGGEGVMRTDGAPEVLRALFEQELPGFGERFRALLAAGADPTLAVLSRATAGIVCGCAVFVVPHSEAGVALGVEGIIVPALARLVDAIRH